MQKYDAAVKKYGDGAVALSNTGKVDEFKIDWESMDGSISDVYISLRMAKTSLSTLPMMIPHVNRLHLPERGKLI